MSRYGSRAGTFPTRRSVIEAPALDDPDADSVQAAHRRLANTVEVRLVDHPAEVEAEPNPPDAPQVLRLERAISVSGRIDRSGDEDAFRFPAHKGESFLIRVESRQIGTSADPTLRVLDAAGKVVAESDDGDGGRDPSLRFTAPADGDHRVVVRDLIGSFGPRVVYLLTIEHPEPDFRLRVEADRFTLEAPPDKPATLKVAINVERIEGFAHPIEIRAEGLPVGVTAAPVVSEPSGPSAKAVTLALAVEPDAAPVSGPFRLFGTDRDDGSSRPRTATAALGAAPEGKPRRRSRTLGPATEHLWLTVTRKAKPDPTPAPGQ